MTKDQCICCGANRDSSFEIGLTMAAACDCANRAPTAPTFRNPGDHLPDCRLRRLALAVAHDMARNLGMRIEVTERVR
jgi:hypothetical protein